MVHCKPYWRMKELLTQVRCNLWYRSTVSLQFSTSNVFTCLFYIPSPCFKKGPGVRASRTCMDKIITSQAISHVRFTIYSSSQYISRREQYSVQYNKLHFFWVSRNEQLSEFGVHTISKDVKRTEDIMHETISNIWDELITKLRCLTFCVKPARDGCSTGVARLW